MGIFHHGLRGSLGNNGAAKSPRPRTEVDDVVRVEHRFLIVFDNEQTVSLVPQGEEGTEEFLVVARVQADGRLIEHVEHAAEIAAELCGQSDALTLAAAQRGGAAVEI